MYEDNYDGYALSIFPNSLHSCSLCRSFLKTLLLKSCKRLFVVPYPGAPYKRECILSFLGICREKTKISLNSGKILSDRPEVISIFLSAFINFSCNKL